MMSYTVIQADGQTRKKRGNYMNIIQIVIEIIIVVLLLALIVNIKNSKNKIDKMSEEDTWKKDILLKQQETLTSVNGIEKSYMMLMEQVQKLNTVNAASSQIISDISSRVSSMNDVMVNKKSRGNWGEYQLNTLLSIYAGESQEIFEVQYPLKNGFIGDVALHLPGNEKVMMIDSKFPLENYQNLTQDGISEGEFNKYVSLFKQNIKKHVNDISKKYITPETVDEAVMFIPSEAIYMYICAEHSDLIEYSHSKHVLITSPTTLLGVVFTLVNATKDFNRSKHVKDIEKMIVSMSDDARRLNERMEKSEGYLNQLTKSMNESKTSADKIITRINKISDGYVEDEKEE